MSKLKKGTILPTDKEAKKITRAAEEDVDSPETTDEMLV